MSILKTMSASKAIPKATEITREEFNRALGRYPALIESLSKPAKAPAETLQELDDYRYGEAITKYSDWNWDDKKTIKPMVKADLNRLMAWKLKHGTWRPKLAQMVDSNSEDSVRQASLTGVTTYRLNLDEKPEHASRLGIEAFAKLKGVGPATASLLLAVYCPKSISFLADEAYYWIVNEGKKCKLSYSPAEFRRMDEKLAPIRERLGVRAVEVEKVAYVLLRDPDWHTGDSEGHAEMEVSPHDVQLAQREVGRARKHVKEVKGGLERAEEYVEKATEHVEDLKEEVNVKDTKKPDNKVMLKATKDQKDKEDESADKAKSKDNADSPATEKKGRKRKSEVAAGPPRRSKRGLTQTPKI